METARTSVKMGLGSYFKAKKPVEAKPQMSEKSPAAATVTPGHVTDARTPSRTPQVGSSRNSLYASSNHSSAFLDDIKHEVMVNYLYQQQCSRLWVSDGSGELEGVLLRKGRNNYMACPPQLAQSPFAVACAALNCQVSTSIRYVVM